MCSQAEVIVRSQVDDFLAVKGADRGLLIVEDAQAEMCALGLEIVELAGEVATSLILVGDSKTTLQFTVLGCQLRQGFQVGHFEVGLG
jgi:hypothetical protein